MIFAPGFKTDPYWWEAAPPDHSQAPLPDRVDVAIVGSGYAGLTAALELARSGLRVAVLDAGPLGIGASTRSGAMVSSGQKLVLSQALAGFTPQQAAAALEDSRETLEFLQALIGRERLDADLQLCGRFFGAWTPAHFETLKRNAALLHERTGVTARIIPRSRQREEIGTDLYHGGMVVEEYGGLHPAKYNRALRQAVIEAGASLHGFAKVSGWAQDGDGLLVRTARGALRAKEVVVATNGYTSDELAWFRRRVVATASYIVATEPLPDGLMQKILPRPRMVSDTRRELSYFRPSPDNTRILFGGRPSPFGVDERRAATGLHARMVQVWPQLQDIKLTHAWRGFVGMTFDRVPHLGTQAPHVHYALGCNGNGVALMSWMGNQTALRILGRQNRQSAFADRPFPTAPFYRKRAWFLPVVSAAYHVMDELDRRRAA